MSPRNNPGIRVRLPFVVDGEEHRLGAFPPGIGVKTAPKKTRVEPARSGRTSEGWEMPPGKRGFTGRNDLGHASATDGSTSAKCEPPMPGETMARRTAGLHVVVLVVIGTHTRPESRPWRDAC